MNSLRRIRSIASAAMLPLFALGCASGSGVETSHDINSSVNFANYQTFAFISEHPMIVGQTEQPISPMLEGRLMESVRIAMIGKGYNEARDPESADMAIAFTVGAREQIKVDSFPASYQMGYSSWGPRYGYGYGGSYGTETRVRQYTEGQLAVDVFDVATRVPAFHGTAVKRLSDSDAKNRQQTLDLIANQALSAFPLAGSAGAITRQ